jgi:ribonuclease HII
VILLLDLSVIAKVRRDIFMEEHNYSKEKQKNSKAFVRVYRTNNPQ